MEMPGYDGILERWKIDLILVRAKRLGFRPHDLPDAMQEVALELLRFTYDSDRANGATERTALAAVIDNRLRKMKRSAARYAARVEHMGQLADESAYETTTPLKMDVAEALLGLTEPERAVCRGLADGMSKTRIARELRCGYHTIDRIVARLREHFRRIGLEGWVEE